MNVLRSTKRIVAFCAGIVLCLFLVSCTTMGRKIISQDYNRYNFEIAKSEDSQLLRNIVRLRYLDTIEFLQITSITAQKTLSGTGSASIALFDPYKAQTTGSTLGPSVTYTDTPTVTFTPLQGADFVNNLLTSVSLKSIFFLCNTNWNVENNLMLSLHQINDYYNQNGVTTTETNHVPHGYRSFLKVIHNLHILQQHNAVDFYFSKTKNKAEELVIVFKHHRAAAAKSAELEVKRLLNISANAKFMIFTTTVTLENQGKNTVAVRTRSPISMMSLLANTVQMPSRDRMLVPFQGPLIPIMSIYSSQTPVNASISTFYRGYYFYIKEDDVQSKRTFILLTNFYQMNAGVMAGNSGIVLSLPTGR